MSPDSEETRLVLFTRVLAISVLLCLAFSWKLWVSRQHYPFVPLFRWVPGFPYPLDFLFLATFVVTLLAVVAQPRSMIWSRLVVAELMMLFMQDQNRLWPSFYQFFFLFLLLASFRGSSKETDSRRVLNGMRFIIAGIYFWGGVQKLTPHFFYEEFPWFVQPLTSLLPFEIPFLPAFGSLAAVFEMLFGIGLLTKRFRNIALYDAMLMHALIFFCIGPLRGNWNNSSWIWGQTMAIQAFVIFYKAPGFEFKEMFNARPHQNIPQALAVLFIGILPVLNNINRWDSGLSFNVYSGNVSYAEIHIRPEVVRQLPPELLAFVTITPKRAILNLNQWALHEFNANPYPEQRIFQAVLAKICTYVPKDSAYLRVTEKAGWFFPKRKRTFKCGER